MFINEKFMEGPGTGEYSCRACPATMISVTVAGLAAYKCPRCGAILWASELPAPTATSEVA